LSQRYNKNLGTNYGPEESFNLLTHVSEGLLPFGVQEFRSSGVQTIESSLEYFLESSAVRTDV
jgi:hypothetical protein